MIHNRMGWRSEVPGIDKAATTPDYKGVLAGGDFRLLDDAKLDLVVNTKVSVLLDCSIEPRLGYYHALVAVNPALYADAEVSAATYYSPGSGRVQPVLHIRALRKFSLRDFTYLATIHLVD